MDFSFLEELIKKQTPEREEPLPPPKKAKKKHWIPVEDAIKEEIAECNRHYNGLSDDVRGYEIQININLIKRFLEGAEDFFSDPENRKDKKIQEFFEKRIQATHYYIVEEQISGFSEKDMEWLCMMQNYLIRIVLRLFNPNVTRMTWLPPGIRLTRHAIRQKQIKKTLQECMDHITNIFQNINVKTKTPEEAQEDFEEDRVIRERAIQESNMDAQFAEQFRKLDLGVIGSIARSFRKVERGEIYDDLPISAILMEQRQNSRSGNQEEIRYRPSVQGSSTSAREDERRAENLQTNSRQNIPLIDRNQENLMETTLEYHSQEYPTVSLETDREEEFPVLPQSTISEEPVLEGNETRDAPRLPSQPLFIYQKNQIKEEEPELEDLHSLVEAQDGKRNDYAPALSSIDSFSLSNQTISQQLEVQGEETKQETRLQSAAYDRREPQYLSPQDLPGTSRQQENIEVEETNDRVVVRIEEQSIRKSKKGLLLKKTSYFSDKNVHAMQSDVERIHYTKQYRTQYDIMPKKHVRFGEDPQVAVHYHNYTFCSIRWMDYPKGVASNEFALNYAADYHIDFTDHVKPIFFDELLENREILYDFRPGTSTHQRIEKGRTRDKLKLLKYLPLRRTTLRNADEDHHIAHESIQLPAHSKKFPKSRRILLGEKGVTAERLMEWNIKSLLRYSEFWQIDEGNYSSEYRYSYGPMIISDSLLEDIEPNFFKNTGLFVFPPPLNEKSVLNFLAQIKPRHFTMSDIIITWGIEDLLYAEVTVDQAVTKLMRAYSVIRVQLQMMKEDFERKGYRIVQEPKYWFLTVPEVIMAVRCYNEKIKIMASDRDIGLIDWAELCNKKKQKEKGQKFIRRTTVEDQVKCLYDELHEKIGVTFIKDEKEYPNRLIVNYKEEWRKIRENNSKTLTDPRNED